MTSEYEGLPMAMIEALSCGLPCIMPDVSNISTIAIHEKNSLSVPSGDMQGFAEQIYRLLTNDKLYKRLSMNAIKIRDDKAFEYSLENATNLWNSILDNIADRSNT
jgi:glycosyltransferase involved in cell wall biosynthesis